MEWLTEHWEMISSVLGVLVTIASIITGLTDTPLDNTVVDVIKKILAQISFAQPRNAEGSIKLPGTSPGKLLGTAAKDEGENGGFTPAGGR